MLTLNGEQMWHFIIKGLCQYKFYDVTKKMVKEKIKYDKSGASLNPCLHEPHLPSNPPPNNEPSEDIWQNVSTSQSTPPQFLITFPKTPFFVAHIQRDLIFLIYLHPHHILLYHHQSTILMEGGSHHGQKYTQYLNDDANDTRRAALKLMLDFYNNHEPFLGSMVEDWHRHLTQFTSLCDE